MFQYSEKKNNKISLSNLPNISYIYSYDIFKLALLKYLENKTLGNKTNVLSCQTRFTEIRIINLSYSL
jgi:hypothetical protein